MFRFKFIQTTLMILGINFFLIPLHTPLWAKESLGQLSIKELYLNPEFIVKEKQEAEFRMDDSSVSLLWEKDSVVRAELKLGNELLKNTPVFFTDDPSDQIGLVEAYGEWDGRYGRLRGGLVPINFGFEGQQTESELNFKRSLLFKNRIVGLRDLGLEILTTYGGYYTKLTVHNGEGGEQKDSRMFFTANWGWSNERNLNLGFAAQTGTTKLEATQASTSTLAGFQSNRNSKLRLGGLYAHWFPNNWDMVFEAYMGSVLHEDDPIKSYRVGHFDLNYKLTSIWSLHARYDYLDPNDDVKGDVQKEVSLGFSLSDERRTSVLYFMGTKLIEEKTTIHNDLFRIFWRLTPQI